MTQLSILYSLCDGLVLYVKSNEQQKCPNSSICHTLSFYSQNAGLFFVSNTTFVFMKGEHKLENNVVVTGVSQIVFMSIFAYNHKNNDKSTISCSTVTAGLQFINSSYVKFDGLRLIFNVSCSSRAGISFYNVSSVNIYRSTIQNLYNLGIFIANSVNLTISECSFTAANGLDVHNESNQLLYSVYIISNSLEEVHYNISDSVFVGNLPSLGGGLHIYTTNTVYSEMIIKGCIFSHIVGCLDSAANINVVNNSDCAHITVLDSVFYQNYLNCSIHKKEVLGGGLKIKLAQIVNAKNTKTLRYNKVIIQNSIFSNNYGAGAGILIKDNINTCKVLVSNSTFTQNIARSRCGGLIVSPSDDIPENEQSYFINIVGSTFVGNQAGVDASGLLIWLALNSYSQVHIFINDCNFDSNNIRDIKWNAIGQSALLLKFFSFRASTITITNCFFVNNKGGSLYLTKVKQGSVGTLKVSINNCYFGHNSVDVHSAITMHLNPRCASVEISYCLFENITAFKDTIGVALHITNLMENFYCSNLHLLNVTVRNSKSGRSTIGLSCLTKRLQVKISNIQIYNNNMTAIGCDRCGLHFSGYNIIANNTTPYAGGGLVVTNSGYAFTEKYSSIIFINNTASKGGALYSDIKNPYVMFSFMYCTFSDFRARFQNNTSHITGDNLYGGLFYNCRLPITNVITTHRDFKDAINCNITAHISQNYTSVSSDPFAVCLCHQNNSINYYKKVTNITVYPGQSFNISLITVGYCGGSSPSTLNISSSSNLQLIGNTDNDKTSVHCKDFIYKAIQLLPHVSQGTVTFSVPSRPFPFSNSLSLMVSFLHCPPGTKLGSSHECVCNDIITALTSDIQCNVSWWPHPLRKHSGNNNWLGYKEDYNCTIAYKNCPFDYCQSSEIFFNLNNDTDLQCNHNRAGLLCGQCQSGLSLKLGSNVCSKCTNIYLLLLIVFMFSGILLVALLITLNLTVSVGTINGLLFYANIIKLNEAVLFPNGNIIIISQFISWINLDFGIEVCLFDGLDGYWKTWLQFVFPFYVWNLVAGIIIISRWSTKLSNIFGRNIVPVLATLILMSFTKLLRTTTNALMTSKLHCGSHEWTVWSVDGNINYGTSKHSILVAFSVVVLVLSIIYSCLIFSTQWLQRYSYLCCHSRNDPVLKLLPFIDAYTGPYKERYRFWTGLLLIVRLLLTVVFIYTSGSLHALNNYIIVLVEMILLYILKDNVYCRGQISILEQSFHINLFVLALTNSFIIQSTYKVYVSFITVTSIAVSMVTFIVTIVYHLYIKIKRMQCYKQKQTAETLPFLNNSDNTQDDDDLYSPCITIRRRESLIFDFVIDK